MWAELSEFIDTGKAAAGRANVASAKVESLSVIWPEFLERVEMLNEAERTVADVDRRMVARELAIARNFSITLTEGV